MNGKFYESQEAKIIKTNVVAQRLGVSRKKVYDLIHRGELAAINLGTEKKPMYRITESALAKCIDNLGVNTDFL